MTTLTTFLILFTAALGCLALGLGLLGLDNPLATQRLFEKFRLP